MAVRADQLALGDLVEKHPSIVPVDQSAKLPTLRCPWKMVPLHRGVMKAAATVDAWRVLKTPIPLDERPAPETLLTSPDDGTLPMVLGVVHLAAALAPCLPASLVER
jgi:hypothetical protein